MDFGIIFPTRVDDWQLIPYAEELGYHRLVPAERRFVTPEAIHGTTVVGTPEEICARLRTAERAGLRELTILPPTTTNRAMLKEFAELVMRQY